MASISTPRWLSRSHTYGDDHDALRSFTESIAKRAIEVEITEVRPACEYVAIADSSVG